MNTGKLLYMLKKVVFNLSLVLLTLQLSCVAQQTGSSTLNDAYSEDLTLVRPKTEPADKVIENTEPTKEPEKIVAPTKTVNAKVDMVLDSVDKMNQQRKFVDGFTIQIYSGQNREEALSAKSKMVTEVSDLDANLQYTQPKFQVTVGRYYSKLEAQKDLMRLRRYFSNAILIPDKILIK